MSYQTYITEALVCGSWDRNTADKSILLFTREAGMLYAQARSVRKEISKQRYALQDAFHVRVTLIRGKTGWKIAGAEALQSLYACATTRETRGLLRDAILLLRRFVHGESPHQDIFDDVVDVLSHKNVYPENTLKTLLFLRVLNMLGYVAPTKEYEYIFNNSFPFDHVMTLSESDIAIFEKSIENALHQSQL